MTFKESEVIALLIELSKKEDFRLFAKETMKGTFITGAATFLGAVAAGPAGMAVGKTKHTLDLPNLAVW